MEATVHAGGGICRVGSCRFQLTKSMSIKLLPRPLRLPNDLAIPNSIRSSRQLYTGIARFHRRDASAAGRFKVEFRAKKGDEERGEEGASSADRRRAWWSDELPGIDNEEEMGVLEEAIDSLWILKVFKSYGWGLPFIMISWLAATGPKAFLMALAIPLGQSAVTFVIGRLLGKRKKRRPNLKRRTERRKKPWVGQRQDVNDVVEEEGRRKAGENVGGTWVGVHGGFTKEGGGKASSQSNSSYGGWDELDGLTFTEQKPKPAAAGKESKPQPEQWPRKRRVSSMVNGKKQSSTRMRESSDTPLVLRLLVAVFPFLAFWMKIF